MFRLKRPGLLSNFLFSNLDINCNIKTLKHLEFKL